MSSDDKERRGTAKPGAGRNTKDLDALKAKLGLKKPAAPTEAAKAKKAEADDFKFSFGELKSDAPSLSAQELAAIDDEVRKAARPLGARIVLVFVGLIATVVLLWLGFQFGNSMGQRVLHNLAVGQAQDIKDFFVLTFSDKTGRELSSRRDATTRFVEAFDQFHEERFNKLSLYTKAFIGGKYPPDWDFEKFKQEELAAVKTLCKEFMTNVEEYSVASILKGQLYSTELGAKLLDFTDKSNKLRNRVEALYLTIELIESYEFTPAMPGNLKPEVLLHAEKAENEKEKVLLVKEIEVTGTPEIARETEVKELCEPISMELEIPLCDVKKGEPETEKRLIDTFQKSETETVKQYRRVEVKEATEGKKFTARIEHLFKIDLKGHLVPLLERINDDKKKEAENFGMLLTTVFQNMNDVRAAGDAVDFKDVVETIEKLANQELLYAP